jgi:hypothetical protein
MESASPGKSLTSSQNGMWRKPQVRSFISPEIIAIDVSMADLLNGQVDQIVNRTSVLKNTECVARLGEAWRFRRTFERGRALMNSQDAWCLKAQAAAATGKLSLLEGQDFPSEIELDVIVGI